MLKSNQNTDDTQNIDYPVPYNLMLLYQNSSTSGRIHQIPNIGVLHLFEFPESIILYLVADSSESLFSPIP